MDSKLLVVCEGPADQIFLKSLLRGRPLEFMTFGNWREPGLLISQLAGRQYRESGIVVLMDSDEPQFTSQMPSRFASLKASVESTVQRCEVSIGCPSPCLEAWLLFGRDGRLPGQVAPQLRGAPLRRTLKREVYGVEKPSLHHFESVIPEIAEKILGRYDEMEAAFGPAIAELLRFARLG